MITARPPHADDWARLAKLAIWLHREWRKAAPARIESGAITTAAAEDRSRILGAIAADWLFASTLKPRIAGAPDATPKEKQLALRTLARQWRKMADHEATNRDLADLAAAIELLLWHECRPFTHVWLAETTLMGRANAAARQQHREAA